MSFLQNPIPLPTTSLEFRVQDTGYTDTKTARIINIFGYRNQWNSVTALGDCVSYLAGGQDQLNTPLVGTTYYLNSTSVQDLTAGSGVDRVRITYLDLNGIQQIVTASLNGTTAVSIGTGFTFIQWMESYHSTTANRVAAGNVTISSINGAATEATTMEMILLGVNRSTSGRYKVPADKHAYIMDFDVSASGANFIANMRATIFSDDNTLSNAFHYLSIISLKDGSVYDTDMKYQRLPSNAIIKLSAIPSALPAGNRLTGSMHLIVEDGTT